MGLFAELQRRNVFRVGAAYIVTAWLVAQVAELVLDAFHAPLWILKALLLLLGLGFLVALVFAWAYELTPEGIKRESEVDRDESVTRVTGRRLDRAIIGILVLIIAFMATERLLLANRDAPDGSAPVAAVTTPAGPEKSVAVLPFADLSESQDRAWFADGLAEEILNALARTPDLLVSSRTSSFKFKGSNLGVPQIAEELGVAHILEGSIRRSGERIRVTAQLIRAADGFHVWSENYDRDAADVIDIQEDLAQQIAVALETTMDPDALAEMARVGTRSVAAYNEYIKGRAAVSQESRRPRESLHESYRYFERARAIDPDFSQAHLAAADYWRTQLDPSHFLNGDLDVPAREMLANFNARIDAAIATARSDIERRGYQARKAMVELRIRDAKQLLRDYLTQRPGDRDAWIDMFRLALWSDDKALAREVIDHWWQLAEASDLAAGTYAAWAYRAADRQQVADRLLQLLERWPNRPFLAYQCHRALLWAGRTQDAQLVAQRFLAMSEGAGIPILSARQGCAEGDRQPAERVLAGLATTGARDVSERWHLLHLLGRDRESSEALRPIADGDVPSRIANFMDYPQFDPTPYPSLMTVLAREGIQRPPPETMPFTCPPPDNTVAVLPFVNMSGDAAQEYFSDGMTEELINTLVRVSGLEVAARTSVFAFKGRQADVRAIGRELGVGHVLEGSVRSDGTQLRITAQLIKVDDGFHLWSETYDRKMENIFTLQEDIAAAIAGVLTDKLKFNAASVSSRTSNLGAYDAYLQGRALLRSRQNMDEALERFAQATRADPGFAPAWAAMAIAADVVNAHEAAEQYALQALQLDPDNVDALNALGAVYRDTFRWAEAEAALDRALAIDPRSSELLEDYAEFLASVGRPEQQAQAAGLGYGIDPYLAPLAEVYVTGLLSTGNVDRAREVIAAILEVSQLTWLWATAIDVELTAGDVERAIQHAGATQPTPAILDAFAALVRNPSDDAAAARLKAYLESAGSSLGPGPDADALLSILALLYAGDGAAILARLGANPESMRAGMPEQFFTPLYASVRQAAGFGELLESIGLPAYWDATSWPEACERDPQRKIRCR